MLLLQRHEEAIDYAETPNDTTPQIVCTNYQLNRFHYSQYKTIGRPCLSIAINRRFLSIGLAIL